MTEMDYTQFNMNNLFDIVADPGFRTATITGGVIFPKQYIQYIRKKKIKNLFIF
jgi:hypothetical protein